MKTRHILLGILHRLLIVPQAAVGNPQIVLYGDRDANIPQVSGDHQGALTGREGAVR